MLILHIRIYLFNENQSKSIHSVSHLRRVKPLENALIGEGTVKRSKYRATYRCKPGPCCKRLLGFIIKGKNFSSVLRYKY